ncbi:hypothetical protein EKI60_02235 [Candidatus Saccharibacteria bacterium]|nr:MAG: hypothetical protein EKI60_02235 [Candidatus Saccharibacteria bacterium]
MNPTQNPDQPLTPSPQPITPPASPAPDAAAAFPPQPAAAPVAPQPAMPSQAPVAGVQPAAAPAPVAASAPMASVPEEIAKKAKSAGTWALVVGVLNLLGLGAVLMLLPGKVNYLLLGLSGLGVAALTVFGFQLRQQANQDLATVKQTLQYKLLPAIGFLILLSAVQGQAVGLLPLIVAYLAYSTLSKINKLSK